MLGLHYETAPTEIYTDASGYGVGTVHVQLQNGRDKEIADASRTLTKAKQNYFTPERECLAVIRAINKFRLGTPFTIVTDQWGCNIPLEDLLGGAANPRV